MTQPQHRTASFILTLTITAVAATGLQAQSATPSETKTTELNPSVVTVPFHPTCLAPLRSMPSKLEELTQGPISCNGPYSEEIEIRGQGWIYADHPRTPEGWPTGYVGYLIHQATPVPETSLTSLWLTVVENGGGNADFNSIWHLHHNPTTNTIEPQYSIIGGDRCNAGGMRIHQVKGEMLYYEHAVSPYRLLNLDHVGPPEIIQVNQLTRFREDRAWPKNRSRNFLGWPFLRTVSDCYACCAGVVVKKHDLNTHRSTVDRVLIDSELTIDDFFERPQLIACAHDWFASIKDMSKQDPSPNGENRIAFTASEWNEKRNELTLACQHVAL